MNQANADSTSEGLTSVQASAIHEELLVLDSHLDTPVHFARPHWNIMERHTYAEDLSQVDYPRIVEGGLDGGFWVIFTTQGPLTGTGYRSARDHALVRAVQIRETVARNADALALATRAADAECIVASGRRVVFQSIENSYPLGEDVSLLDAFYRFGVRLVGPVHAANNQFADSSTDPGGARWGGLSELGVRLAERANQLGMIIDASHASDEAFDRLLELSRTPVILSHSGVKAVFDSPRNIDDARLRNLADRGGVIQVAAVSKYLVDTPVIAEIEAEFDKTADLDKFSAAEVRALARKTRELHAKYCVPVATFQDFMRGLLHALQIAGVDHVGIGIDWDGGGGVNGLADAADLPKVTAALLDAGYSRSDLAKIMSGNLLRVLRDAERGTLAD